MTRAPLLIASLIALVSATPSAGKDARFDLSGLAGVYKTQFNNGLISGERYRSENVLEIVEISVSEAYVRAHLEFFNGHSCGIYGIAHPEGQRLVYRTAGIGSLTPCEFSLYRQGGKIVLSDNRGTCQQACGARGMFEGQSFPIGSRKAIRYMARLKASREYAEAITESRQEGASPPLSQR